MQQIAAIEYSNHIMEDNVDCEWICELEYFRAMTTYYHGREPYATWVSSNCLKIYLMCIWAINTFKLSLEMLHEYKEIENNGTHSPLKRVFAPQCQAQLNCNMPFNIQSFNCCWSAPHVAIPILLKRHPINTFNDTITILLTPITNSLIRVTGRKQARWPDGPDGGHWQMATLHLFRHIHAQISGSLAPGR